MTAPKNLSIEEFLVLLTDEQTPRFAYTGRADWFAIYRELKKTDIPLDIATIHKQYVKGVVTRFRTKNVLLEWAAQGKCQHVFHNGRYWFYFGRRKKPRKKSSRKDEESTSE